MNALSTALVILISLLWNRPSSGQIQTGAPWPMFGRNQFHSSNSPFLMNSSSSGKLRWKLSIGSITQSSPSIGSDGTIYFGTDTGNFFAVTSTGEIVWTYQTGGSIVSTPAISSKDMIFFGSWDKYFYALQASTGSLIWKYKAGDFVSASPVIDSENTVYFGAGSTFYAIYDSGLLKWKAAVKGITASSPSLSSDGILFLSSYYSSNPFNSFYSFYSIDGRPLLAPLPFGGGPIAYSSPTIGSDGSVYIGSALGDYIFKLSPDRKTWGALYGTLIGDTAIFAPPTLSPSSSTVYAGALDGYFYAINTTSGKALWNFTSSSAIVTGASVVGDGSIIVGDINGMLSCLSTLGKVLWTYKAGSRTNTPAIGSDGTVYVTSYDKYLHAVGGNFNNCPAKTGIPTTFNQFSQKVGICVGCDPGSFSLQSICNSCSKGKYSNLTGLSSCSVCTPGTYAANRKTTVCTLANKGSYVSNYGSSESTLCTDGTYSNTVGARTCTVCAVGTVSGKGAAACTVCEAGKYSRNHTVCSPCPIGKYSNSSAGVCTACAIGTYASEVGKSVCTSCNPGYVSNRVGASACTACRASTYASSTSVCTSCPWPSISVKSGSVNCSFYAILPFGLGTIIGCIVVFGFSIILFLSGIFMVDSISDINTGVVVTKIGVLLFLMIPFLEALSNIIYLLYQPFANKILLILFILTITVTPSILFTIFLYIIGAKPRLLFIIVFPFGIIIYIIGIILHQTRIFGIKKIWNNWLLLLCGNDRLNCTEIGLESSYVNRCILYGSCIESVPLLILQIINNVAYEWNYVSVISVFFSCCMIMKSFSRFPFDSLNSPISHIPIKCFFINTLLLDTTGTPARTINGVLTNDTSRNNLSENNFTADQFHNGRLDYATVVLDCGDEVPVAEVAVVKPSVTKIRL